jgi:hypothetical protein
VDFRGGQRFEIRGLLSRSQEDLLQLNSIGGGARRGGSITNVPTNRC